MIAMGYGTLNAEKQRAKDQARIRELEEQLNRERSRRPSPENDTPVSPPPSEGHVTVERTSKKLKRRLILSWITCIGGFTISCFVFKLSAEAKEIGYSTNSYSTVATIFSLIGLIGLINVFVTKLKIWWNHG